VGRAVVARGGGNGARARECAARAKKSAFMRVFARRFQPARRRRRAESQIVNALKGETDSKGLDGRPLDEREFSGAYRED